MGDQASSDSAGQLANVRVAMLLHGTYPWDERVKREAEALAEAGCHVDVICLQRTESEPLRDDVGGVSVHRARMRRTSSEGKLSYIAEYAGSFFRSLTMLASLNSKQRYELVQVHTLPDFLVFATLPAKISGARILLDIHDLMPELYASKFGLAESSFIIRMLRLMERASIGFSDHVITASEAFRDRMIDRGVSPEKVTVVLNTADPLVFPAPEHLHAPAASGRFTMFWHGTMVRRYGVDLALRACALVRDRIPGLRFIVYGEGEDSGRLHTLADELSLQDVVEFRGHLPHTELAPLMAMADLGIVSNRPDIHIDRAYPTKLFEFIQMGLPVVATRTKVLEGRFGEDSVVFCDIDEHSLAEGILWVYEHPDLAQARVVRARAICDEISWDKMSATYVRRVAQLLGRSAES